MNYQELDLEEYFVQKSVAEFPGEIREVLSRIIEDLHNGKSIGKAPKNIGEQFHGHINLIPSDIQGSCHSLLVGICYDKDNFDTRMLDFLDHASKKCPNKNKRIFFFSTQWNSWTAGRHAGYIEALRRNGVIVDMIYVTRKGLVLMPV